MNYTVQQLAKLSGVSVRTLHWYDKKGLLKPAYVGDNQYRYYGKDELLRLQQILFFKELDISLEDIKTLLSQKPFDVIQTLGIHRKALKESILRKETLLVTIDKTINHLEEGITMENDELYYGFDSERQKEYEKYLVNYKGLESEKRLEESKRRTAKWGKEEWDEVKQEGDAIHKALANAIDQGLGVEDESVQNLIHRHYTLQNRFFDLTKEVYLGLPVLYRDHPDFKKFFDVYHPDMIDYLAKAIRYYARENL